MWYSLGKEYPEMVWLPEPKHIGAVLKDIGQNYRAALETEYQTRGAVCYETEPSGRDILHSLKEQIRARKLYLKYETAESKG